MRPRVFPAENRHLRELVRGQRVASMRPRVFPAENALAVRAAAAPIGRFNEAAGIPRGKPVGVPLTVRVVGALQ